MTTQLNTKIKTTIQKDTTMMRACMGDEPTAAASYFGLNILY